MYLLAWIGSPLLLVLGLRQLAPFWLAAAHLLASIRAGAVAASFVLVVVNALVAGLLVWYYLRRHRADWHSLGLRQFNWPQAAIYIIALLFAFGFIVAGTFWLTQHLFPSFNPNQVQTNEFTAPVSASDRRLSFLALVVIPPLIEEVAFRGFIFPAFSKRFGVIFGALASSLLFGLAHWQANISLYTLVLGLVLCMMYVRLRSIVPGIFLHMINNYIAFITLVHK